MSRDLIRQLKKLQNSKANPREAWVKANRDLLLRQVANTVNTDSKVKIWMGNLWSALSLFLPRTFVYNVVRPIAVLLVVAMVGTSGWIATVDAAYESIPGDILYPAKRAVEKTQLAVAGISGAKEKEAKLHVEFAKRRAVEIKIVAKSDDPNKTAKVSQSVKDLKTEIQNASTKLEEIKENPSNAATAVMIKDVAKDTESIKNVLQEVKTDLQTTTNTPEKELTKEVSEVKDLVKDTAVKAVEVMVEKHLQGDKNISEEDVKKAINTNLNTAVNEVVKTTTDVQGAKVVVDAVNSEVKEVTKTTTSTKELAAKITDAVKETKEAVVKAEKTTTELDKTVTQVQQMLSTGNLSEALSKVKEVSTVTKEAEKVSDQTLIKVQEVLPIVNVVKEIQDTSASATGTPGIVVVVTTTPKTGATTTTAVPQVKVIVTTTIEKKF